MEAFPVYKLEDLADAPAELWTVMELRHLAFEARQRERNALNGGGIDES